MFCYCFYNFLMFFCFLSFVHTVCGGAPVQYLEGLKFILILLVATFITIRIAYVSIS
jgi:hypothetical protein